MPLCKVESIENITEQLEKQFIKENMWFIFYKSYPFSTPNWFDSDESYIAHQKLIEEDKQNIDIIYPEKAEDIFENKEIKSFCKDRDIIRFYTLGNDLWVAYEHDQCIPDGIGNYKIGYTSNHLIKLINSYISKLVLQNKQEINHETQKGY